MTLFSFCSPNSNLNTFPHEHYGQGHHIGSTWGSPSWGHSQIKISSNVSKPYLANSTTLFKPTLGHDQLLWLPLVKKIIVDNAVGSTGSKTIMVLFASFKITLVHDHPLWLPLVKKNYFTT